MLLRSLVTTFALTALTAIATGCTASEPTPSTQGPVGGGDGNEITNPGAASKGCLAGATKNEEGGYCVNLPQGSSTTATSKGNGAYEYTSTNGNVLITVKPGDKAAFEAEKTAITAKATSLGGFAKSTDTAFSSVWRDQATAPPRTTLTMVFANDKIIECTTTSPNAGTLNACQSLRAL